MPSRSGSEAAAPPVTVDTLKQILDAFNRHDLDRIMEFFAADCVMEMPRGPDPWGRRYVGKQQVREGLASRFAGLPDVNYGKDTHWVCGSRGVSEWTITGTTPAGVRVEARGCDHFEFKDGKIKKRLVLEDRGALIGEAAEPRPGPSIRSRPRRRPPRSRCP